MATKRIPRPRDPLQLGKLVVDIATGQVEDRTEDGNVKLYGEAPESAKGRYSPAECIGARKQVIEGRPDPTHVSTSYAERQNLTMRMHMRRFTRLTNAFSKKAENHAHPVSLKFMYYN